MAPLGPRRPGRVGAAAPAWAGALTVATEPAGVGPAASAQIRSTPGFLGCALASAKAQVMPRPRKPGAGRRTTKDRPGALELPGAAAAGVPVDQRATTATRPPPEDSAAPVRWPSPGPGVWGSQSGTAPAGAARGLSGLGGWAERVAPPAQSGHFGRQCARRAATGAIPAIVRRAATVPSRHREASRRRARLRPGLHARWQYQAPHRGSVGRLATLRRACRRAKGGRWIAKHGTYQYCTKKQYCSHYTSGFVFDAMVQWRWMSGRGPWWWVWGGGR